MMMRTTLSIDDDMLRSAAEELGTQGAAETLRAALAHIVAERKRRDALSGFDLISTSLSQPEALDGAWR
ncbi:type II toxin-antitoxin system VapB family antitoxin [Salinifilum ghardaiensis]